MRYNFLKLFLLCVLVIFFSILFSSTNAFANELCSKNGYTILTVNGIFTNLDGAKTNAFALKHKLIETTPNLQQRTPYG